jgi:general secretion pathway protein A
MYLDYYCLDHMPFDITPDPRFLWLGPKHKEAYASLCYAMTGRPECVVMTGEPGTGKNTLVNAIMAKFESDMQFGKITDPALNELDFLNLVSDVFQIERNFQSKSDFLHHLNTHTKKNGSKKMILVINEAQRLTIESLEQIHLITKSEPSIGCIFTGQTGFLDILRQHPALNQKIGLNFSIDPLTQDETEAYILHRLLIAGRSEPLFTSAAVREIFDHSGGIPCIINTICDQSLMCSYYAKKLIIGPEQIKGEFHRSFEPARSQFSAEKAKESASIPAIPKDPPTLPWAIYAAIVILIVMGLGIVAVPREKLHFWMSSATKETVQTVQTGGPGTNPPEIGSASDTAGSSAKH